MVDLEQAHKEYIDRRLELIRVRERWVKEMRIFSVFLRQRREVKSDKVSSRPGG